MVSLAHGFSWTLSEAGLGELAHVSQDKHGLDGPGQLPRTQRPSSVRPENVRAGFFLSPTTASEQPSNPAESQEEHSI